MAGSGGKKWHGYTIVCPRCERAILMKKLAFTSGGEISVRGICPQCKMIVGCEMDIAQIMADCCQSEKAGRGKAEEGMMKRNIEGKNWVN